MSLAWLLWRDARANWRGKEAILAGAVLVALLFLVFLFAGHPGQTTRAAATVLWVPLVLAAAAAGGRSMAAEHDRGTLELLRGAPVQLGLVGVSQTVIQIATIEGFAALAVLLAWALFAIAVSWWLLAVLAASALGLAIVGTLAGALAASARARDALVPILLVPAAAPLVQAGVDGTLAALAGAPAGPALALVVGYDLVAAGVAWLLWPIVLEVE